VRHCNHGAAFGRHQVEVLPGDGTRDFLAHLSTRVPDGTRVKAGDKVGEVGAEGNVTGPHLHFERHSVATGGWSCTVIRDPQASIDYQEHAYEEDDMPYQDWPEADQEALANDVAAAVWRHLTTVTKPDGTQDAKTMGKVVRETWSKLSKHMDKGG
jgi:murein DD-endopeptidase MepM/ murein hydrolase activator NlpD